MILRFEFNDFYALGILTPHTDPNIQDSADAYHIDFCNPHGEYGFNLQDD